MLFGHCGLAASRCLAGNIQAVMLPHASPQQEIKYDRALCLGSGHFMRGINLASGLSSDVTPAAEWLQQRPDPCSCQQTASMPDSHLVYYVQIGVFASGSSDS